MAMKGMFARHGIPERVIADNMQFDKLKVKSFPSDSKIEVVTLSPHYPKSNGLMEKNVQTIKRLLRKADESKQDAFLALLELRNSQSNQWHGGILSRITYGQKAKNKIANFPEPSRAQD